VISNELSNVLVDKEYNELGKEKEEEKTTTKIKKVKNFYAV